MEWGVHVSFAIVIDAQGPVATALFLGDPALFNTTREDCIWKHGNDRDQCPDADITMYLFPPKKLNVRSKVNQANRNQKKKTNHFLSLQPVI